MSGLRRLSAIAGAPNGLATLSSQGLAVQGPAYDPKLYAYNCTGSAFARLRAAIAKGRAASTPVPIVMFGDSTTAGVFGATPYSTNNVPARTRYLLGLSGKFGSIISDGVGVLNSPYEDRWGSGTGWGGESGYGFGGVGAHYANNASSVRTFTPTTPCDSFVVTLVVQSNSGTFNYKVDGGTGVPVVQNTSGGYQVITISAGTRGMHTLTIDPTVLAASKYVFVESIEPVDSTAALRIGYAGITGSTAANWTTTGGKIDPLVALFDAPTTTPALAVVGLGTNELNNNGTGDPTAAIATYKTGLTAIVTKARAKNADVLFVGLHPINAAADANRAAFVQGIRDVCDTQNVGLLDMSQRWPSTFATNFAEPYVFAGDALHPSSRGYWDWAQGVTSILTGLV